MVHVRTWNHSRPFLSPLWCYRHLTYSDWNNFLAWDWNTSRSHFFLLSKRLLAGISAYIATKSIFSTWAFLAVVVPLMFSCPAHVKHPQHRCFRTYLNIISTPSKAASYGKTKWPKTNKIAAFLLYQNPLTTYCGARETQIWIHVSLVPKHQQSWKKLHALFSHQSRKTKMRVSQKLLQPGIQ